MENRIDSVQAARFDKPTTVPPPCLAPSSRRSGAENAEAGGDCKYDQSPFSTHRSLRCLPTKNDMGTMPDTNRVELTFLKARRGRNGGFAVAPPDECPTADHQWTTLPLDLSSVTSLRGSRCRGSTGWAGSAEQFRKDLQLLVTEYGVMAVSAALAEVPDEPSGFLH